MVELRLAATLAPLISLTLLLDSAPTAAMVALLERATIAALETAPQPRSAPAPGPTWQPSVSRRESILSAARQLFRARRYVEVTIDDIGEAAGISGPAIYHHFPNKAALLTILWEREAMRLATGMRDAIEGATSATDALARLVRSTCTVALDSYDLVIVLEEDLAGDRAHLGLWNEHRLAFEEAWTGVLTEVHPDLTTAEIRLLMLATHLFIRRTAESAGGDHTWIDEVTAMALAFATPPD